jgi:hypothetical protein
MYFLILDGFRKLKIFVREREFTVGMIDMEEINVKYFY